MSTAPMNNAYHPAPKTVESAESNHARQELTYTSVMSAAPAAGSGRVMNNPAPSRPGLQKIR
jgi:hypothetical protein